jgi:uncharacterized membrane-anchored protein
MTWSRDRAQPFVAPPRYSRPRPLPQAGQLERWAAMSASPTALASIALIGFWLIELLLRKGASARSWRTSAVDRGSTVAIVLVYIFVAVTLAVQVRGPRLPPGAQWLGGLLAVTGVVVRVVAFRTLGSSYSRTLRVAEEQALSPTASIGLFVPLVQSISGTKRARGG